MQKCLQELALFEEYRNICTSIGALILRNNILVPNFAQVFAETDTESYDEIFSSNTCPVRDLQNSREVKILLNKKC